MKVLYWQPAPTPARRVTSLNGGGNIDQLLRERYEIDEDRGLRPITIGERDLDFWRGAKAAAELSSMHGIAEAARVIIQLVAEYGAIQITLDDQGEL